MSRRLSLWLLILPVLFAPFGLAAAEPETSRGDRLVAEYFRNETQQLTEACLADVQTLEDWQARRDEYRRQLFEMLALDPLPPRTPLQPVITGEIEQNSFVVEKLHFQSRPGLYVTASFYRPAKQAGPLPAVLYVCGHSRQKQDGVSFGNKAGYQHHGAWFARNGYVCLTIDTLQLGEIEGIHHGTYNHGMWWWNARGYSSAGVEAWNCIRALDYLETRPEVDADRIGVTGRSGGGAYSWWIAALDERIKAAVPVAGITSLRNHVVDGCVEGHCDCMYQVNTYRWDYPLVAALVAPRPLLIANTDKDRIFPLDGVVDVYFKVRKIYELYGAADKLGLQISEGPHKDIQELQVAAFHWMNRHLQGDDPPQIETTAVRFFEPHELKVFDELPADAVNAEIQETFTQTAPPPTLPADAAAWAQQRDRWLHELREKSFRGWPATPLPLEPAQRFATESAGVRLEAWEFNSQHDVPLSLYIARRAGPPATELDLVVLNVLDEAGWKEFSAMMQSGFPAEFPNDAAADGGGDAFRELAGMLGRFEWGMAWVAPRGIGTTAWSADERTQTHIRRRFMLLGQTLDGMRVWDVRRAVQALKATDGLDEVPVWLQAEGTMAGIALYASLYEPGIERLDLYDLPRSHRDGPIFLNVLRILDMPAAVAVAAERSQLRLYETDEAAWEFPRQVVEQLEWSERKPLQIRSSTAGAAD